MNDRILQVSILMSVLGSRKDTHREGNDIQTERRDRCLSGGHVESKVPSYTCGFEMFKIWNVLSMGFTINHVTKTQ